MSTTTHDPPSAPYTVTLPLPCSIRACTRLAFLTVEALLDALSTSPVLGARVRIAFRDRLAGDGSNFASTGYADWIGWPVLGSNLAPLGWGVTSAGMDGTGTAMTGMLVAGLVAGCGCAAPTCATLVDLRRSYHDRDDADDDDGADDDGNDDNRGATAIPAAIPAASRTVAHASRTVAHRHLCSALF